MKRFLTYGIGISLALFTLHFALSTFVAHAAELSIEPDSRHTGPGFSVRLVIRYDEPVNALEGVLIYDPAVVSAERIIESPNGVPLWITRPASDGRGRIEFAGIFPGGIEPRLSDRMSVMDIAFSALQTGRTELSLQDVRVFRHADPPVEDKIRLLPVTVDIGENDLGTPDMPNDDIAPESFSIVVSSDGSFGSEGAVAVYGTRDMQTGVDTYEIREKPFGLFGSYRQKDSPAVLSGFWRWSIIEVRATDRAGNAVTARFVPIWLVATYVLFGMLAVWRIRRWRRR